MFDKFRSWFNRKTAKRAGCRACGICCELYGHTVSAGPEDVNRWRAEGRLDLLSQVGEEGVLWVDSSDGQRMQECPHLERLGSDSARCGIHATKPRICRDYPTPVHAHRCVRGVRFPGA